MERSTRIGRLLKILYPGIRIKRWLLIGTIGIAISSAGLAYLLRRALLSAKTGEQNILPDLLPWHLDGLILITLGISFILWSMFGLYQTISPLLAQKASLETIGDVLYRRRALKRGPNIVAIGGGTGLSVLLRGLKSYTDNLTAIITVADDGGSSGRLRGGPAGWRVSAAAWAQRRVSAAIVVPRGCLRGARAPRNVSAAAGRCLRGAPGVSAADERRLRGR